MYFTHKKTSLSISGGFENIFKSFSSPPAQLLLVSIRQPSQIWTARREMKEYSLIKSLNCTA
ncbi:hypothetical protein A2379_00955 [Candidatus Amesbacteria bacterium RIFOXYB1_FULL_47_13]|nr:MAG: hypothetical protein A2379_00955 [Candidatus Amesbacteria bacterium RIFOXYB1_FULL_47_13]